MKRRSIRRTAVGAALLLLATGAAAPSADADHVRGDYFFADQVARFATFNVSLNRNNAGDLGAELAAPGSAQPDTIAEIIQRTRPDVLLLNEFDFDPAALVDFQENYLGVAHGDAEPIDYPYSFIAPSNTGEPSGFDYDNNGTVGGPNDAYGFGFFPGQFGMAVLSKFPIDVANVRTFQNFRWKDMPGALLPDNPATPEPDDWYSPGPELDSFRLSSKSHWDVPITIGRRTVHFLVSHPTPPVFDGDEDRNGRRNHDEIRFWSDYVGRPSQSRYIYDDDGEYGGLQRGSLFVIAGDQNADPFDGDSIPGAVQQLLHNRRINGWFAPESAGAVEQSALQGGANLTHLSDPAFDTADFNDAGPGNLRVDYVLPSRRLRVLDAGVFWPTTTDPDFELVGVFNDPVPFGFPSSDHRLVWVDIKNRGFRTAARP